jgi:NADPH-dependent curcumin reductase CurA
MPPSNYKAIVLNSRPEGDIEPNTFRTEVRSFSDLKPGPGQVLVQCTWLSLDPAMRGYIRDVRSYLPPVQIGEVMRAGGLGVVIATGSGSTFRVGDHVYGAWGE